MSDTPHEAVPGTPPPPPDAPPPAETPTERVRQLRDRLRVAYARAAAERQEQVASRATPLSLVGLRIG